MPVQFWDRRLGPLCRRENNSFCVELSLGLPAGLTCHVSCMHIQLASPSFPPAAKAPHPLSGPHRVGGAITVRSPRDTRGCVQPTGPHVTCGRCDSTHLVVVPDPRCQLPLVHKLGSRMQWSCCGFSRSALQEQQTRRAPCDISIPDGSLHGLAPAVSETHKVVQCTIVSIGQQIHCQGVLPHGVCISGSSASRHTLRVLQFCAPNALAARELLRIPLKF